MNQNTLLEYKVKDINLAEQGRKNYELAKSNMPVLAKIRDELSAEKPFAGQRIAGAIHVTKETAVLIKTLQELGAEVAWAPCNPLSTQDDIAAYLTTQGVKIYAWRGCTLDEYYWSIDQIIATKPTLTMDDGCDVVFRIHDKAKTDPSCLEGIIGGTEETTTGVHRLESMSAQNALCYPIIAVNNAETKWDFDNIYGTGQGTIDGILRATSMMITGKTFVVSGYGHCGKGVAKRARGMGAKVVVTEINPIEALRAKMEGFDVMPMNEAAKIGDIFVTATGIKDIITNEHFPLMKNGAVLSNTGHFNVEVNYEQLKQMATVEQVRPNMEKYTFSNGKYVYLLAEGRLVNLSAAEGHPSEVMDLSFSNQVLALKTLIETSKTPRPRHCGGCHGCDNTNEEEACGLPPGVYGIKKQQDQWIAAAKLEAIGVNIDHLTDEQKAYTEGFGEGTK